MDQLKEIKKDIHMWNAQEFGSVNDDIKLAQYHFQKVHNLMSMKGFFDDLYQFELDAHVALDCELEIEG